MTVIKPSSLRMLLILVFGGGLVWAAAVHADDPAVTAGAQPDAAAQREPAAPEPPATTEPAADPSAGTAIPGPRALLRMYGIDDSHFEHLIDGRPIVDNEGETLLKVLYRIKDFSLVDLDLWAQVEPLPDELLERGADARGDVFRLSGRVTAVDVLEPIPEVIERYGFRQYYRCDLLMERSGKPAIVFARDVPKAWRQGDPIDAAAGAYGLFLKLAGDREHPVPVFVARRIAWHPKTLLGELGMDAGLLDDVQDQHGLTGRDREAFYQMLTAVGRARPGQLLRAAKRQLRRADRDLKRIDDEGKAHYSVVPLFNEPQSQRGRLVALSGTARRVLRVPVGDADIVERFGIDHYYNIFLFTEDSQENPVVFCVRDLPAGMPTGDGPGYGEYVTVAGFFLKSWAYRVPAGAFGPDAPKDGPRMQLAPLLIGREPVWVPREKPTHNALVGAIAGGLFLVVLLGIWLALWAYGRGDKRFHDRTLAKKFSLDSGVSLNELGLEADAEPDFSGLEAMEGGGKDEGEGMKDEG